MALRFLFLKLFVVTLGRDALASVPELPPIPSDKATPFQQRLAYNGPTSMFVGWNTYQQIAKPTVNYGTSPNSLTGVASSGNSVTYPTSRTWTNSVLINGLTPATTYYYKISSTNSSIDTFTTARTAGDSTPFSIAAVIDLGLVGQYGYTAQTSSGKRDAPLPVTVPPSLEHSTIAALANLANKYSFVLHPGDFGYADDFALGWIEGVDPGDAVFRGGEIYEGLIELFYNQLSLVSRFRPYMAGVGNHEADCIEIPLIELLCPNGQKNFTGYYNHFGGILPTSPSPPPSNAPRARFASSENRARHQARATAQSLANPPFWYSFDYGMTHFVVFDTETDLARGVPGPEDVGGSSGLPNGPFGAPNQQVDFLHADLSGVNRQLTPWVVVAGHRPWYSAGTEHCTQCQQVFEPIFNQYNVDLAIFGHVHNMQRLVPLANGVADPAGLNNPKAPWYIINGAAGNIEGRAALSSPAPSYLAWGNDSDFGFSLVNFLNRTHLEVQFVRSSDGAVVDNTVLYKAH